MRSPFEHKPPAGRDKIKREAGRPRHSRVAPAGLRRSSVHETRIVRTNTTEDIIEENDPASGIDSPGKSLRRRSVGRQGV